MDFILYFILRYLVPVPNERNLFEAPGSGFYLPSSLAVTRNFARGGPRRVLLSVL